MELPVDNYPLTKVLVVDDQPLIVEELCEFLESSGYECVRCHSSLEAIEHFSADSTIGIVLCDLEMPGMNGIEMVEAMKMAGGKTHLFEAIMLTGQAEKKDVIKALRAGIADYYQKPVDLEELLEAVQLQVQALHERQKTRQQLGLLNEKLQFLAASIDDLYQNLDSVQNRPQTERKMRNRPERDGQQRDGQMPVALAKLSPRQLDVARLVSTGLTNYQIACELGITENTVKLYVSQVLRLTHMHNRTQLALAFSPGKSAERQRQSESQG
ncbi:response regulator transcription factor [Pseudomonas syringae pv. syringae]|uniref:Response regulator transcription factor n=2 Tax=Pseudomonas fragariae (ex Marin et al. 2024) TaxID=3080056 RepID=A0ABT3LJZ7_9PSED|nr:MULTISPECIES: response regulator transcription factor [Pseudomonas]MCW6056410.1 response regulator transcription factor [Pseudomonas fragi]MCH5500284.1 response regulator transcription factor [Pseudomonas syringae pv. syringae]MCH5526293.1 response regulator transcription factor [Pseudomonas syringae pv. syringae]MCH5531825.1 response regulator transcription factor [Pseudomonas syringae pv. syringae]MCH5539223.1 response regulator transcription factor [Pseudomonas syringae pv. syringae]